MNNQSDNEEDIKEEQKYVETIEYRGYSLIVEYNSEGVFYNYQNFENDVLKRAIRFIGGTAIYVANPLLGGAEMIGAMLSDVFIKEGYELANKIKQSQGKLYDIDNKIDQMLLSRCTASIKFSLNWLKEYQMSRQLSDFKDFYEKAYQCIVELSNFLWENKPIPSFMNAVTTLVKLLEEGIKTLNFIPKTIVFKCNSVKEQIVHAKELLSKQWVSWMKTYSKQISFGRKKIKKFMNPRVEYYADDKLHGIAIRIIHKPSLFWNPKETPEMVLRKYIDGRHLKHIINECSMTYEFVKEFIDQEAFPVDKYWAKFEYEETPEVKKLIFLARLRQDSNKPVDALNLLEDIVEENKQDLSSELKLFFKSSFTKALKASEKAWEEVNKAEKNPKYFEFSRTLNEYKEKITGELLTLYRRFIKMIRELCFPKASSDESKLFYLNMICDYKTNIANIIHDDELLEANDSAFRSYEEAYEICGRLESSNPSKLSLINKYTIFLFEIKLERVQAVEIIKLILSTAENDIDDLNPALKEDAVLHINAMKENLKAWKRIK